MDKMLRESRRVKNFLKWEVLRRRPGKAGFELGFPGLGRSPGERNGYPLQYSCLENSMDRGGVWWVIIHGVTKGRTQLSNRYFSFEVS